MEKKPMKLPERRTKDDMRKSRKVGTWSQGEEGGHWPPVPTVPVVPSCVSGKTLPSGPPWWELLRPTDQSRVPPAAQPATLTSVGREHSGRREWLAASDVAERTSPKR